MRALTGVAFVIAMVAVIVLAATLFRGGFTDSVPVTVMSPRAGLVMNPDAKVQIRGVQVGKVDSIEQMPNGEAAIHLAMDPKRMSAIPANVLVDIASTTVFGAKYVQFVMPPDPSPESLRAGQVLAAKHVMVEINTVFENLTSVLSKIDPAETQRDARRHRVGRQRARREDRPDAHRPGRVPGQDRTEPARAEPRSGNRPAGSAGVRRRRTRLRRRRRQRGADQRHDRRPAAEPRRRTRQRHRPCRHRQRRHRHQPAAARRCPSPAGADHRSAEQVQPGAVVRPQSGWSTLRAGRR